MVAVGVVASTVWAVGVVDSMVGVADGTADGCV